MPAYDFRCEQCGHSFTERCSIEEKSGLCCPACGGTSLKQIFTGCAFITHGAKSGSEGCAGGGGGGRFT